MSTITIITNDVKIIVDMDTGKVETEKKTITKNNVENDSSMLQVAKKAYSDAHAHYKNNPSALFGKKRTYNPDVTKGTIYPKIMKALSGRGIGNVGISPIDIARMTGLGKRQVGNAIYKLSKVGKIKAVTRGMWVKA